ncbi:MAG: hypothetical protein HZB53_20420 [Chloroflexi bacterium]|nr:hypothetical protein [Chloroflexota bacterium]
MTQPGTRIEIAHIVDAARRLGVELHESEAIQWLTAIAATQSAGGQMTVDEQSGVYGFNVTMLDFDTSDLERYRRIGALVGIPGEDGVETALSLSGSAAQSRVQLYPGDCDYFERVNIAAPTREAACLKAGDVMRRKVLSRLRGPNYQFVEGKIGRYPADVVVDNKTYKKGSTIRWSAEHVEAGRIDCFTTDGKPLTVTWEEASRDPGWCKIDWLVAEPEQSRVTSATNQLDVTWEAPDGTITPLDGFLDPYFQEVYLDAASIPLFTKLSKQVSPDALDNYVGQLEHEIMHYVREKPNFGKAAKRMYNIFRLTGRYEEAVFIRELFDEPAARLYQVWALLDTLEEAHGKSNAEVVVSVEEIDKLIETVVSAAEGPLETKIVMAMLKLRDVATGRIAAGPNWAGALDEARLDVAQLVNDYFRAKLYAIPPVKEYLDKVGE